MNDPDAVEQACATLRVLSDTCSAASDALQQPVSAPVSSSAPPCTVLHRDFVSLLSLTYASTTKVTLTLRPPEPAYAAALAPLRDLVGNVSALTTCATLFGTHGTTLAAEARLAVRDVCEALHALARTFLEDAGTDYLVRTGAVHDAVDRARTVSVDNRAAVRRRWAADKEMLDDAMIEVAGMLEDTAGEDEEGEDDGFDDEWDELRLGSTKKMSEAEMQRTKQIQPLLRFATLLHKRTMLDILSNTGSSANDTLHTILDAFPAHSQALVLASEELVASLYAPQDISVLASAVSALADVVRQLRQTLLDSVLLPSIQANSVDELANGVGALSVSTGGAADSPKSSGKRKDTRKWFDTCFAQIDSLSKSIGDTFGSSNET